MKYTAERSDWAVGIKLVVNELWDHLADDWPMDPREWEPRIDDSSRWYVIHGTDDKNRTWLVGFVWAHQVNNVTWQAHTNIRPEWWGKGVGLPASKTGLDKIIEDTGARKVIAIIPETSPHVLRLAKELGFSEEGRRLKSWQKDGELYDEVYLGLNPEEIQ